MCINVQELSQYTQIGKDILTAFSAVVVAIVSILGLKAWKKQLKGKTEYELARRLLRAVYKIREAISYVRNPFVSSAEISQALQEANVQIATSDSDFHKTSQGAVYQMRWKKIGESVADLDIETLEAETIWGSEVKEKLNPLRKNIKSLQVNILRYLRTLDGKSGIVIDDHMEKIIYVMSDDPAKDSFTQDVLESIKIIEEYLKVHLRI